MDNGDLLKIPMHKVVLCMQKQCIKQKAKNVLEQTKQKEQKKKTCKTGHFQC